MCASPFGVILGVPDKVAEASIRASQVKEVESIIGQIKAIAAEINFEYPAQNLREFRPFFGDLKTLYPKEKDHDVYKKMFFENNKKLYERKRALVRLLNSLKDKKYAAAIAQLPERLKKTCQTLLRISSLGAIANLFRPTELRLVKITPPAGLPPYTTLVDPARTALTMALMVNDSPKISRAEESTAQVESKLGEEDDWKIRQLKKRFPGKLPIQGQRPYEFYISAYGIDRRMKLPGLEKLKRSLKQNFGSKVTNPFRLWIADYGFISTAPDSMKVATLLVDRYIDLEQHLPIFQYLKTYEWAYRGAAAILHRSHPDISVEAFTALLMVNTMEEMFWIQNEDPWQDAGAASWYNAPQKNKLLKTYKEFLNKGYIFGIRLPDKTDNADKIYTVPVHYSFLGLNLWRIASTKVPVAKQGFGPNAVLTGDFLKAADRDGGKLWEKYFPGVKRTESNAVKIALDPAASVGAVALVFDGKLRDLNRTMFQRGEIRMPDNAYPTIWDLQKSREYFKLSWLRYCKAFPEAAVNFPEFFPYSHYSWNIEFLDGFFKIAQAVLDQKDSFPGLQMQFIPSKGKPVTDYFGNIKEPRNYDALMFIATPNYK